MPSNLATILFGILELLMYWHTHDHMNLRSTDHQPWTSMLSLSCVCLQAGKHPLSSSWQNPVIPTHPPSSCSGARGIPKVGPLAALLLTVSGILSSRGADSERGLQQGPADQNDSKAPVNKSCLADQDAAGSWYFSLGTQAWEFLPDVVNTANCMRMLFIHLNITATQGCCHTLAVQPYTGPHSGLWDQIPCAPGCWPPGRCRVGRHSEGCHRPIVLRPRVAIVLPWPLPSHCPCWAP
jgi:hypothetical protein